MNRGGVYNNFWFSGCNKKSNPFCNAVVFVVICVFLTDMNATLGCMLILRVLIILAANWLAIFHC